MLKNAHEDVVTDFIKFAAVFAFLTALSPVPATVASGFGHPPYMGLVWFGVLCYACVVGFLLRMLLFGLESGHAAFAKIILFLFGAALTAAIVAARLFTVMFAGVPFSEVVLVSALFIAAYFIGVVFYALPYRRIMTKNLFAFGVGLSVVSLVVLRIAGKPFSVTYCAFMVLIAATLFALVNNQGHIDYLMERRRHGVKYLPKKIRSYNISLISLLCGFFALGFLFRSNISESLSYVLERLTVLLWRIVAFFQWLAVLIAEWLGDAGGAAIEDGAPNPADFFDDEEHYVDSRLELVFVYVFFALLFVLLTALLYGKRHKIKAFFSAAARRFLAFSRLLFAGASLKKSNAGHFEYYDVEESVTRERAQPPEKTAPEKERRLNIKMWKRRLSIDRKMDEGSVKYRFGYRLAYDGYRLCGKTLEDFHTPNEAAALVGKPAFDRVKDSYNYIRYAESELGFDTPALNKTLNEILNHF
jgi:hypothetical protein